MRRTHGLWWLLGLGLLALSPLLAEDSPLAAARAAVNAGRLADGDRLVSRWLETNPDDAGALYLRARGRAQMGREGEAAADYRRVLAIKPDSSVSAKELAQLLERLGRRDEAGDVYRAWLRREPANAEAMAGAARCPATAPVAPTKPADAAVPATVAELSDHALVGARVGVSAEGLDESSLQMLTMGGADVASSHLLDYTFGSAPTDWQPAGGRWQVFSRFACDPTWSFFGGWSTGLTCIWNKKRFAGDQVVEAYVSFKHGLPFNNAEWSYRPADLCLTLCGDGKNPDSGYSFIYAGDEASRTLIRRGQKVLGSTTNPDFLTPSYSDVKPDTDIFHRRWWRLEAHVRGNRLTFYIDGQKAVEAVDPAPLTAGQVALWTVRNGMMVARVRIAYAGEQRSTRPPVRIVAEPPIVAPARGVASGSATAAAGEVGG
ncbi:MAG: hypothetical protein HZB16_17180 [Armatimonadetes bacterium]|nr:hypothetical protein [Armatimonadota bacterium]